MGWLVSDGIQTLTTGSLLLLVVLFFMLGWIRPKSAITEIREIYDARLVEAHMQIQEWREAHRLSEDARRILNQSVREALEQSKTSELVMESLRIALEQSEGSVGK